MSTGSRFPKVALDFSNSAVGPGKSNLFSVLLLTLASSETSLCRSSGENGN